MTARRDLAPLAEALRTLLRACADLGMELVRFLVGPRIHCPACRLRSFLVRHTCGRPDYLRSAA